MKKISVMAAMTVEITDKEYELLQKKAYDPMQFDGAYNSINAPEWLLDNLKRNGVVGDYAYIPGNAWFNREG